MLAGPVCHIELVRIARKRRTYVLRFLLGLLMLALFVIQYSNHDNANGPGFRPGEFSIRELAELGRDLTWSILAVQVALVLGVTPGLVADAIGAERRRKTLHDLLTSRLSGGEIVRGKLAARLLEIGAFMGLVFPIASLLTLIGGVSPLGVVLGYLVLASSAYFLGSLSILSSVLSRRPREAVGSVYFLAAAWLFLPGFVQALLAISRLPVFATAAARSLLEWSAWIWPPGPWALFQTGPGSILSGGTADSWRLAGWTVGMQAAYGTLFLALAGWQLRPAYRRHESRAGRIRRAARADRRGYSVRPCGDDPIFWKEAHFSSAVRGLGGRLQRGLVLTLLGLVLLGTLYASRDAFRELVTHGYGTFSSSSYNERMMLNVGLRIGGAVLFGFWMLSLGGSTAATFTSEHEQDTWISLLSTPLERNEILRGKMLGPLRATAPVGGLLLALWLIGLAAGAVHPLGLLSSLIVAAILTWFVIALGTHSSVTSKVTWRARTRAQGILVASHLCCMLPIPSALVLMGLSLWSYPEIHEALIAGGKRRTPWGTFGFAYYFGGLALYATAALLLTRGTLRSFDRMADRPRRPAQGTAVPPPGKGSGPAPISSGTTQILDD